MRVHISGVDGLFQRIYIVDEGYGDAGRIARFIDGRLEWQTLEAAAEPEPTLKLDGRIAVTLFPALAKALDGLGVRTDTESKLAGTLEATRAHLADLRKLLHIERNA